MASESNASFANRFDDDAVGRLMPGVSPARAEREPHASLPSIEGVYSDATRERIDEVQLRPIVVPLKEEVVGPVSSALWLVFGGMTFLLLVASANVAACSIYGRNAVTTRLQFAARWAHGGVT